MLRTKLLHTVSFGFGELFSLVAVSDIFSARGRKVGVRGARKGRGSFSTENPRIRGGGRGRSVLGVGAKYFFSGPKCPPSFGNDYTTFYSIKFPGEVRIAM